MKNDKKMIMVKSANTFQTVTKWWKWMRKIRQNDEHMKKNTVMKIGETHDETWLIKQKNMWQGDENWGEPWWNVTRAVSKLLQNY